MFYPAVEAFSAHKTWMTQFCLDHVGPDELAKWTKHPAWRKGFATLRYVPTSKTVPDTRLSTEWSECDAALLDLEEKAVTPEVIQLLNLIFASKVAKWAATLPNLLHILVADDCTMNILPFYTIHSVDDDVQQDKTWASC